MRNVLAALVLVASGARADVDRGRDRVAQAEGEEGEESGDAARAGEAGNTSAGGSGDDAIIEREPPRKTPFDRGKMNLSIAGGTTSQFDKRYFAIGAGFGYYVLDGVELGVSAVYQFGDGPSITNVRPRVTYVAQPLVGTSPLIPYVGAFYNHWFVGDGFPDVDTVGGRAGAIYVSGRLLLGLGIAVERYISECTDECWDVYPDFSISVSL